MAQQLSSLVLVFGSDISEMRRGLDRVESELKKTEREVDRFGRRVEAVTGRIVRGFRDLLPSPGLLATGFVAAAGAMGGAAIKLAADLEQSEIAFETLLGSSERAQRFLADLFDFAAHPHSSM